MENTQTGDVKMPITYEDLKQSLVDSGRPYDFDMIDRAYALAEKAHGGQRRRKNFKREHNCFHNIILQKNYALSKDANTSFAMRTEAFASLA